ncbi:helix-turn-helix domain-containing protein [Kitasatospora sp. DSM 101779]|uniref:helix-turn-helix domain-containing protein n=1 Tax=Kitasatospora sp. DSM 101779 TaxID=2853165 RepID=UPI0021DB0A60|nr:helix-turn-helix transcriptional regulator [Kitasatospora sp. DSM 101779]
MSGSGRPERPLDRNAGPLAAFACDLRLLREGAGLTYRQMAVRAGYSHNALAQAAGGNRLPSLEIALAFASACGGGETEWKKRWCDTKDAVARETRRPADVREPDRWTPLDESTHEGRFAAYLRTLYLVHERPPEAIASEIGRPIADLRCWLDGKTLPVLEDLLALLRALHAPPGGVAIARRLHDHARDTGRPAKTRKHFRISVQWGDRHWALLLGNPQEGNTAVR